MNNRLLKDPELQQHLEKEGYVVVPFLEEKELLALRNFYNGIHPNNELPLWIENIHMTSWCEDFDYKLRVKQESSAITHLKSEEFFDACRFINHVFIVKKNGPMTSFKVHQDWNVVDETKFTSVNIWVPLWDVDAHNGALWVLPGSHKINRPIRGAGYLFPDYGDHLPLLEGAAKSVDLPAGHAMIFYHNVIHGSPPNNGEFNRVALAFSALPKEAPLAIYFQKNPGDPLEQHEPADDFMYHYKHIRSDSYLKGPTETPAAVLPSYVNHPVSEQELLDFLPPETVKALELEKAMVSEEKKAWWKLW